MKIGFIGLGTMGGGMAANFQRAKFPLTVYARRREAAESFLTAGAAWAATPRELAESSDVVFICLPGPTEVEQVVSGLDGVLAGMQPEAALFDLTTNAPDMVRRLHAQFAERGALFFDAPVSGGPRGAASGKMAIWVGGDAKAYPRYEPVLRAISDQPRYLGPIGSGSITKLVNNCSTYIITCALAETFAVGVKAGMEPLALWEAVRSGALGRRRTFDGMIDQVLPGSFEPAAFALRLARKDVGLMVDLAHTLDVPMPFADQTLQELDESIGRGWAELDSRAVALLPNERAGVSIAVQPDRLRDALQRDPPAAGDPKHG